MSHLNVSLIVWAKSQDSVHKPQFLKRKERAEADRTEVLLLTSLLQHWPDDLIFITLIHRKLTIKILAVKSPVGPSMVGTYKRRCDDALTAFRRRSGDCRRLKPEAGVGGRAGQ